MACYRFLLAALLFVFSSRVTAQNAAFLRFVDIPYSESHTVQPGDNTYGLASNNIRFPFGNTSVYSIYVSTNGYFSMGEFPMFNDVPNFPLQDNGMIVAPFGADIDTYITGSVRYTSSFGILESYSIKRDVSNFIRANTLDDFFLAENMIVAEWDYVAPKGGSRFSRNRFQGILITDGTASYAVFIYECANMMWGGGVIGWQESPSNYVAHQLSGKNNSNSIGCLSGETHTAIIYRISACDSSSEFTCDDKQCIYNFLACDEDHDCEDGSDEQDCSCESYEFQCDNGDCIFESETCDSFQDCSDGSDEHGCTQNLPTVLGIIGGVIFLFGSITCVAVGLACLYQRRRRRRPAIQTTIATTAPHGQVAYGQGNLYLQPIQPTSNVDTSQYQPQQAVLFSEGQKYPAPVPTVGNPTPL